MGHHNDDPNINGEPGFLQTLNRSQNIQRSIQYSWRYSLPFVRI